MAGEEEGPSFQLDRSANIPDIGRNDLLPIQLGGKNYEFKYEQRCHVCTAGDQVVRAVNRMLVEGYPYRDILKYIEPLNEELTRQISYSSLRNHWAKHMPQRDAAVRAIVERRSQQMQKDFIEGTQSLIDPYVYAEVMVRKSFEELVKPGTRITPKEGLEAAKVLNEFMKQESEQVDISNAISQLNQIITAVRSVVPPEMYTKIIQQIQSGRVPGTIDAELVRADQEDEEDYEGEEE